MMRRQNEACCVVPFCDEPDVGDIRLSFGWRPVCARHYDSALAGGQLTRLASRRPVGASDKPTARAPKRGRSER